MISVKSICLAVIVGLLLGSLSSWHFTSEYKDAKHQAVISKMNEDAAKTLAEATTKAIAVERANNELATTLEVQHEQSQQQLDKVLADNQRLARELGGLRDPGRKQNCSNSVSSTSKSTVNPKDETSGAYLSAEATEFLLEFARDADRAAEYAGTCADWVKDRQISMAGPGSNHARTEFRM